MVDLSAAHRMASAASDNGNVWVMYFSTRSGWIGSRSSDTGPEAPFRSVSWLGVGVGDATGGVTASRLSNSNAVSIGPHRLPTTRNSSITNGAALNSLPAAHVLFKTRVPIGRQSPLEMVKPAGLPVASTTTSYFPACSFETPLNAVSSIHSLTNRRSTPLPSTNPNLCACFPNKIGGGLATGFRRACSLPSTSAIINPNFPSPRIATRSGGRK
mmetsp:Transcript_21702/g.24885  ORF Transcript_21702/g.24885 Transcript_21702/m.24885 type:complete len:214 (-) Transcript_21702:653-1294(-)